jgi:integrase
MKLSIALEVFLSQKSKNTKRAYLYVWERWLIHCPRPQEASIDSAADFIGLLINYGASHATVRQRYQVLHSIYDFLVSVGASRINPWKAVAKMFSIRQCVQVRPTKLIPSELVTRILFNRAAQTNEAKRNRAIVALLFGTGIRISELQALNVGDVMTSPSGVPYLHLWRTKAGKVQSQPIPEFAWEHLSVLICQRKAENANNYSPLFVGYGPKSSDRCSISTIYRIYRKLFDAGPHSARATFATRLKDMGFADEDVAVALRHSTTQQVKIYDKRRYEIDRNVTVKLKYDA